MLTKNAFEIKIIEAIAKMSLADTFCELRQLTAKEDYTLEMPSRQDRPNSFAI